MTSKHAHTHLASVELCTAITTGDSRRSQQLHRRLNIVDKTAHTANARFKVTRTLKLAKLGQEQ